MTQHKQLKALVRARMARTGEPYMVARRHILTTRPASGYPLRGGIHPETASLANALAGWGIADPATGEALDEAMILGLGGGLGAGYILWQWERSDTRVVTTGFRNQWQYPQRWLAKVCQRLGVPARLEETAGEVKAAATLDAALAAGMPAVAAISAADLPYWHLPAELSGWIGYPVVVYGRTDDGRYLVDDRNQAPLTVAEADLRASRGRISSYRNRLVVLDPAAVELEAEVLVAAVRAGLEEQVAHLGAPSDSFSLPAFAKWAKMLVHPRQTKGWPVVFADGRGLVEALVSVQEAVDEAGMLGGNLRSLYASFLDQAGPLTGLDLGPAADAYRTAAATWAEVGARAGANPAVAAVVAADRRRRLALGRGDAGWDAAAAAAADAATARADAADPGLDQAGRMALFGHLAEAVTAAHQAETAALATLAAALG